MEHNRETFLERNHKRDFGELVTFVLFLGKNQVLLVSKLYFYSLKLDSFELNYASIFTVSKFKVYGSCLISPSLKSYGSKGKLKTKYDYGLIKYLTK